MKIIHAVHPEDFINYNTQKIREKFLLENLVSPGKIECAYTHYDRMIRGSRHAHRHSPAIEYLRSIEI
jgi:4-deoxy-L-threo-5-hexosulose-uronate ketol-isomerase